MQLSWRHGLFKLEVSVSPSPLWTAIPWEVVCKLSVRRARVPKAEVKPAVSSTPKTGLLTGQMLRLSHFSLWRMKVGRSWSHTFTDLSQKQLWEDRQTSAGEIPA